MNLLQAFATGTKAMVYGKVILDKPSEKTIVSIGKHKIKRLTKEQVEDIIRNEGSFHGYLSGSLVNPRQILRGWKLAVEFDAHSIMQLDKRMEDFEKWMKENTPEFGEYAQFYQIIKESEKHEDE